MEGLHVPLQNATSPLSLSAGCSGSTESYNDQIAGAFWGSKSCEAVLLSCPEST